MPPKTLIFIPTYNERENAPRMCEEIQKLGIAADVLICDDNSPDGTGKVLEDICPHYPFLSIHHRTGKLGIGSAHLDGITWAYEKGYERLVTMDCDFTHSPTDIPKMIGALDGYDVIVGSRFLEDESLPGWSPVRKLMTGFGHFLTQSLLGIRQDASGAFRVYDLTRIPPELFKLVTAKGYAFFFESLFILSCNKFKINEIPIVLPSRSSGASKMSLREIWRGVARLFLVSALSIIQPRRFILPRQT